MKENMKVIIKSTFDGKVSNVVCHQLNELCGQKWTKEELRRILNSTEKCYLNEIGRKYMVGKRIVKYASAYYILLLPKQFFTVTGLQVYVWIYRKNTNESFGKINVGIEDTFDYDVVRNYFSGQKRLNNQM